MVVVEGSIGHDDSYPVSAALATVVAVGLSDLFVEASEVYTTSIYRVPQKLCQRIDISKVDLQTDGKIIEPEIGDLVLSFKKGHSGEKDKKVVGFLYKVNYRMGKPTTCTLMCGTDFYDAQYNSLIVLKREFDSNP